MKKQSQIQWVKQQLTHRGFVTRNAALKKYITRLAARIADLRNEGWEIEGKRVVNKGVKNYSYRLVKKPE